MKDDLVMGAALVGVLALGGVLVWREFDKKHDAKAANVAAGAQLAGQSTVPGVLPGVAGLLPAGTSSTAPATVADLAAAQRAESERLAVLQRQNQIDTLRRDLARVWNDIDVLVVQANAIKNRPIDPAFRAATIDAVWAECKARHRLFPTTACIQEGTGAKAEAAVPVEWAKRIALELQPIQAQLSRLNAEQLALIDNLRALGYTVPLAEVKKASV